MPQLAGIQRIDGGKKIDVMKGLFKHKQNNAVSSQVIDLALKTIPHVSCPVISGVLKALEVSTGLALVKDATIRFK